jgi:5'(3')-deoxyribonucleotidase
VTKQAKLQRIANQGCTHFIDDLPEFLGETNFPTNVKRILFDPNSNYPTEPRFVRVSSWTEVETLTT